MVALWLAGAAIAVAIVPRAMARQGDRFRLAARAGAADAKAASPTFGLTLNLIYSAIAFAVSLWAWPQTSR